MSFNGKKGGRLPYGYPKRKQPFSGSAHALSSDEEAEFEGEDREKQLAKAFQTVCNILGYADQTENKLREKLRQRGYSSSVTEEALARARELGFLDEYRLALRRYRYLAEVRLLGEARIRAELRQYGFQPETVAKLDADSEELCDIDFAENCAKLLRKRGGVLDRKNYAYLRGKGFSGEEIAQARRISAEKDSEREEPDV